MGVLGNLALDISFGEFLWSLVIIFFMIVFFVILFQVVFDLFRDHELSGWAKAGWLIFIIVLPFLGLFVYLIVRGKGMAERSAKEQVAGPAGVRPVRPRPPPAAAAGRPGDRQRQDAPRRGRDHPGGVRRAQAQGAGLTPAGRGTPGGRPPARRLRRPAMAPGRVIDQITNTARAIIRIDQNG